jgi:NAD(P)-dependent dehydrogenase (short-subunit alcohol dehydrogenase family)
VRGWPGLVPTSSPSTLADQSLHTTDTPQPPPDDFAETVRLVESEGRKIVAKAVDVRDLEGRQRVVADAVEQFGRLDIAVANAGVMNWGRLWEISSQHSKAAPNVG